MLEATEERINAFLRSEWNLHLGAWGDVTESVKKLADFYLQKPTATTPWKERWAQIGYLAYFLPRSILKLLPIMNEALELGFFQGISECFDFGSGPGPWKLLLDHEFNQHLKISTVAIENNAIAKNIYLKLHGPACPVLTGFPKSISPNALCVMSHALVEQPISIPWDMFDHALIVEPGHHKAFAAIAKLRNHLIKEGFHIWAPCTHEFSCPMARPESRDWCHFSMSAPVLPWLQKLGARLPFESNHWSTSYLIASRRPSPIAQGAARLTGGQFREKGKIKFQICRGENQEQLTWLSREGNRPPKLKEGMIVRIPESASIVGHEIRIQESDEVKMIQPGGQERVRPPRI